jgi:hypothetical protein
MDLKAEGEALMKLSRDWSAKVATTPLEEWIDFWVDDAVMMPPGLPPVRGGDSAVRRSRRAGPWVPD